MSNNQFEILLSEIQSLKGDMNARLDLIEQRLHRIEADLDKIEVWTGYRADYTLPSVK